MGMDVFDLFAKISLDSSQFDSGLDTAKGKMSSFGGALSSGLGTIAKVGAAAVGAAATGVMAFGTSAVKAGASFDTSMAQVAATLGKTTDEITDLRDFAQEMGRTTAFSASRAADALNYMALAGYDSEKSMAMLPNVLNLAAAGAMDLGSASDMLTDAQSALGLSQERTNELVDQMAKTASKSNTSVSQLGSAMLTIGGTAKQLHGGFATMADGTQVAYDGVTELSAALGILADNGVKGSEGGTALRNVLNTFSGKKFAKTFGEMGVEVYDATGEMRSMKDILQDMNGVMDGMTTEEKTNLINSTFNSRDLKNVNALLATSTERWDELTLAIGDSKGAAEEMAGTQLDNLNGDITLFKSALEGAQIAVSDQITPSLRDFVQLGTKGLSDMTAAFKEGGLTGAMDVFGNILSEGLNLVIGKLPDVIGAAVQVISAFGQGLMQNMPMIISAGTQIINMLLQGITSNASGFLDGALQIVGALGAALLENTPALVETGLELTTQLIKALADGVPTANSLIMDVILRIGDMLIQNAPLLLTAAMELISNLASAFASDIPLLIPTIIEVVMTIASTLVENIGLLVQAAIDLTIGLANGLIEALPIIIDMLPTLVQQICDALLTNLPLLLSALIQIHLALVQAILSNLPEWISAVFQIIVTLASTIIQAAPQILDAVIQILLNVGSEIVKAGGDFLKFVGDSIANILKAILAFLMDLPVKMAYWAGYAVGQFMKFFAELPDKAKKTFDDVITKAAEFVTNFPAKASEAASGFVTKIKEGLASLPGDMLEFGSQLVSNIWEGISGAWDWLVDMVKGVANNFLQGIIDGIKGKASEEAEAAAGGGESGNASETADVSAQNSFSGGLPRPSFGRGGTGFATANNNTTINVYPSAGMDEKALAREINYRLAEQTTRKYAARRPVYA